MNCEYSLASPAWTSRTPQPTTSAAMISSRIDYGFNVEWAPKWVTPGDTHRWQEVGTDSPSGEWHFRECLTCGRMTRHANSGEADEDYRSHSAVVHQVRHQ